MSTIWHYKTIVGTRPPTEAQLNGLSQGFELITVLYLQNPPCYIAYMKKRDSFTEFLQHTYDVNSLGVCLQLADKDIEKIIINRLHEINNEQAKDSLVAWYKYRASLEITTGASVISPDVTVRISSDNFDAITLGVTGNYYGPDSINIEANIHALKDSELFQFLLGITERTLLEYMYSYQEPTMEEIEEAMQREADLWDVSDHFGSEEEYRLWLDDGF